MPIQPIVDKKKNFTEPELILSYLIDNQMISGPDAIILLKAIIENQKKEPEPMLLPREEKAPISIPSIYPPKNPWGPDTTSPRPYDPLTDPIKVWFEANYNRLPSEYKTFDDKNCLTTIYNMDNTNSITADEVTPDYSTSSTEDIFPFQESQVFNKNDQVK